MAGSVRELSDQTWESEVLRSPQPVLVDFWAGWCAPCKTLAPTIEALARELDGRLRVGTLNVEENAQVPYNYNVTTLPTLILIRDGQVREQRVGLISRENLLKLLEPHLR